MTTRGTLLCWTIRKGFSRPPTLSSRVIRRNETLPGLLAVPDSRLVGSRSGEWHLRCSGQRSTLASDPHFALGRGRGDSLLARFSRLDKAKEMAQAVSAPSAAASFSGEHRNRRGNYGLSDGGLAHCLRLGGAARQRIRLGVPGHLHLERDNFPLGSDLLRSALLRELSNRRNGKVAAGRSGQRRAARRSAVAGESALHIQLPEQPARPDY